MDLYRVLNVSRTASLSEIKAAYRKMAMKLHPDTCKAADRIQAEERFKVLVSAYQTLSDANSRRDYDDSTAHFARPRSQNRNRATWDPTKQYGRKHPGHPPRSGSTHYDVEAWEDAHYGVPQGKAEPVVRSSSWMQAEGNEHAAYYSRRRQAQQRPINPWVPEDGEPPPAPRPAAGPAGGEQKCTIS